VAERQVTTKPEIAAQKKVIKLPPAIGDWTTYKPPKILVKKVKSGLYGFDRISKEETNQFLQIHYRFLGQLAKELKIKLGLAVEIHTVNVEQTTYINYLRTLSGPIVQGKISISEAHDPVHVVFSLPIANSIINYSLGNQDLEPINRGLTEAENIALNTTMNEFVHHYAAAFENIITNPVFKVVSSPDATIDNSLNTSSTFVCFNAEIALGDNPPARFTIGYLGNMLKALLVKYNKKIAAKPLDFSILPASLLKQIMIPVTIKLGQTTLSTDEINSLESGDVVSLNNPINNAFEFKAGKTFKLPCQPGSKEKKLAVKISAPTEAETALVPPPTLKEEIKPVPTAPAPITTAKPMAMPKTTPKPKPFDDFLEDDLLDEDFENKESEDDDDDELDEFDDDDDFLK